MAAAGPDSAKLEEELDDELPSLSDELLSVSDAASMAPFDVDECS
jgi:hypothetical protein